MPELMVTCQWCGTRFGSGITYTSEERDVSVSGLRLGPCPACKRFTSRVVGGIDEQGRVRHLTASVYATIRALQLEVDELQRIVMEAQQAQEQGKSGSEFAQALQAAVPRAASLGELFRPKSAGDMGQMIGGVSAALTLVILLVQFLLSLNGADPPVEVPQPIVNNITVNIAGPMSDTSSTLPPGHMLRPAKPKTARRFPSRQERQVQRQLTKACPCRSGKLFADCHGRFGTN